MIFLQSPVELLNGIAQGSKTLIGSTVYAVSSATSHFSKTAYKVFMLMTSLIIEEYVFLRSLLRRNSTIQGLVAFTYDEQAASKMEERERQLGLHGEGVLNGFLEVKVISLGCALPSDFNNFTAYAYLHFKTK